MDRIEAMRAFITVVTEGSFTRAADRLGMSPQLVSKYVSRLEEQLGARLLNRTTRKVHLTEAGDRYALRVQQVLDDIDDMDSQLNDLQQDARGQLRISAPVSFATLHLAPLICHFQRAHPAVSIDLQLNDRKVDIVEEGFDIALRIGHLKSSSMIAKLITPVRLVMCASPVYLAQHGMPSTLDELKNHRYLRYSYMEDNASFPAHEWLRTTGHEPRGDMVSNNGEVLLKAAIEGAGIIIQPTFICGAAIAEGKLRVILPEYEPDAMGLYAVYAHRKLLASKVRCFIDFMTKYFGTQPNWDNFDLEARQRP
ncbi:LysR family transcriptional regulator [Oceanisphaera arctica]|uniref:LysR family transcriptional regulator n=1 Tax=Oceanisphaera arctica TaxID=641510 RepID=A0A2P5TRF4_9GAMM|nr:LysR family transcriptional regulator [Oceanisphaera arctica]PPL18409.1 LysR family transcriptional regulator [Oceanisphaera arctica]GHA27438.1 LysR family transcriptional regulator [Oceanisphaera arctica]